LDKVAGNTLSVPGFPWFPEVDRSLSSGLREEAQDADTEVGGVGEDEVNFGAMRRGGFG